MTANRARSGAGAAVASVIWRPAESAVHEIAAKAAHREPERQLSRRGLRMPPAEPGEREALGGLADLEDQLGLAPGWQSAPRRDHPAIGVAGRVDRLSAVGVRALPLVRLDWARRCGASQENCR